MGWWEAIALALLQGLTEFLPVSSSGHLGLLQRWFGPFQETDLTFSVLLHLGTLLALLVYFRRDIIQLVAGTLGSRRPPRSGAEFLAGREVPYLGLILLGTLPSALVGFPLKSVSLAILSRPPWIALLLLVTGTLLAIPRFLGLTSPGRPWIAPWQALLIGTVQGIAVLPGISRSGSTIVIGLLLGIDRNIAAKFSFHLAVPAILGAAILEGFHTPLWGAFFSPIPLAGFLTASLTGYLAIGWVLRIVVRGRLEIFSYYCWLVGVTALLLIGVKGSW